MLGFIPSTAIPARYNIAPSQPVLIVRQEVNGRKGVMTKWGLVPSWADDPAIGNRMINARSETAASKPAFRHAYRHRRCLIPADGFYEWSHQGKPKQPYYIHRADNHILAFAGLWEHWQDANGNELETCAILTVQANDTIKLLHDRMPAILEPEDWSAWLASDTPEATLAALLRPAAEGVLDMYPVSSRVNSPTIDDEQCLKPNRPDPGEQE